MAKAIKHAFPLSTLAGLKKLVFFRENAESDFIQPKEKQPRTRVESHEPKEANEVKHSCSG